MKGQPAVAKAGLPLNSDKVPQALPAPTLTDPERDAIVARITAKMARRSDEKAGRPPEQTRRADHTLSGA